MKDIDCSARAAFICRYNPGSDVVIKKYFRPKNWRKNWRFWFNRKLNFAQIWTQHCFLRKTPIVRRKLPEIAENCDHKIHS
jgi:hypothetical protein